MFESCGVGGICCVLDLAQPLSFLNRGEFLPCRTVAMIDQVHIRNIPGI